MIRTVPVSTLSVNFRMFFAICVISKINTIVAIAVHIHKSMKIEPSTTSTFNNIKDIICF